MQTKTQSVIEVGVGTVIGLVVNWCITRTVIAAVEGATLAATVITITCTVWSLARGYAVRRYFNMRHVPDPTNQLGPLPGWEHVPDTKWVEMPPGSFIDATDGYMAELRKGIIIIPPGDGDKSHLPTKYRCEQCGFSYYVFYDVLGFSRIVCSEACKARMEEVDARG